MKKLLAIAVVGIAGCVSQTTVETKLPDQAAPSDATYRARLQTELSSEYFRTGNMSAAISSAQQAISVMPSYAPAHSMLGLIYMELKEDAKAQQAFDAAMKYAPNDSEILNNYGWFICQRQSPARSIDYFRQALKNPLYATPERALFNSGVCSKKAGDMASAEAQFRAAVQRQPQFAPPLYELAELQFAKGQVKEAEMNLARHNQLVGTPSIDVLFLGARIARVQGDKNTEASYVQQMRRRFPDAPQTRLVTESR